MSTILLLLTLPVFGQNKHCFCDENTQMNEATVSCDTTFFSNDAKLYWQYDCERIWLTLENSNGQKNVIDEVPVELYGYTYRLGFQLIKEFNKTILFRSGCPANGPCIYTLIDKNNGNKVKEFDQLICVDTDINKKNPHKYNFDFVIYISDTSDYLIIYYLDSEKTLKVPLKEKLTSIIPQYQFVEMMIDDNILTIFYELENKTKKSIRIDLNDEKYIQ